MTDDRDLVLSFMPDGCICTDLRGHAVTVQALHGEKNLATFHTGYGFLVKWNRPLKYFITNFTPDIKHELLIKAIERSIDRWASRVKLEIVRFFDPDFSVKADWFEIKFVKGSEMINQGALAEAQRGIVRINDDWFWAVEPEPEPRNLEYTLTHELGHAIFGMLHGCGGIMDPRYKDVRPDINDCTIHDAIMDHRENKQWASDENFRNEKQAYWDSDLNLAEKNLIIEGMATNPTNDMVSYAVTITGGVTRKGDLANPGDVITGTNIAGKILQQIGKDDYYFTGTLDSIICAVSLKATVDGTSVIVLPPDGSSQDKLNRIQAILDEP